MNEQDVDRASKKLMLLLEKSKKGDRERFIDTFKQIRKFGYDSKGSSEDLYKGVSFGEDDFKATINRVAEYVEIMGASLYPQNPDASVVPMVPADQWQEKRFKVEADILDFEMKAGDLETHARRALNEGLAGGRGIVWYGWNPRKEIAQAVFDTVENFFCDPDAKCPEEINWIARKRTKPRFEFKKVIEASGSEAITDVAELKGTGDDGDLIEYTEFYFRVGIHNYCHLQDMLIEEGQDQVVMDDSPRKYIVSEGKLISISDWGIPLFLIDRWPCSILDFRLQPEKLWPVSTLEPVLCHIKAMNWLYTFYLNRVKKTSRITFARVSHKGVKINNEETEQIMGADGSGDAGIVDIDVANIDDPDVRKYFQAIKLDAGIDEFDRCWALVNRAFEDGSGMNDLVRTGQDANQLRTAADVDFKSKRSMTRIDDMRKQVQVWFNEILYCLAFINRRLMSPEDVTKRFGKEAGAVWGMLAGPEEVEQEKMQRMQLANGMMQEAMMRAQMQNEMNMQMMAATPVNPMMPPPIPPPPAPVPTPEDIEAQMGPPMLVSIEDWINEARREIVAGSMRTIDHDAQVDNLTMFFSALAPVIGPTPGGIEMVAAAFVEYAKMNRYSADFQAAAQKYLASANQMSMMPPPGMAPPPIQGPPPSQGIQQAALGQAQ